MRYSIISDPIAGVGWQWLWRCNPPPTPVLKAASQDSEAHGDAASVGCCGYSQVVPLRWLVLNGPILLGQRMLARFELQM